MAMASIVRLRGDDSAASHPRDFDRDPTGKDAERESMLVETTLRAVRPTLLVRANGV